MNTPSNRVQLFLMDRTTLILVAAVLAVFGVLSPRFLTPANLMNLLVQASSTTIVGVGMTLVLLLAGVDLSVGAIMFVAAALAGKLVLGSAPVALALAAAMAVGLVGGAINAVLVTKMRILAFVATLGTLFVGRGLGLWITETRAMNLPGEFLALGTTRIAGVPVPVIVAAVVVLGAHLLLTRTPFGRRIYAVGHDTEAARKAGVDASGITATVFVASGLCAALGGILSLAQLGAVSPTFGLNREFAAIAAAVLGGTSLFGGRGSVLPGTVLGAVLIQSVENGLVIVNADPYLYPLFTSGIIFIAVLLDSTRARLHRR